MANFVVSNQNAGSAQNLSSTYKTIIGENAATGATTLRRSWLMEWEFGTDGARQTTSIAVAYSIDVMTAAGTGSALTPQVNDIGGGDAAALATYTANYTAEPTVTANSNLWYMPLDQQASYRVQMRDQFSAIIGPAVNLKGWVCRAKSATYASTVGWRALVQE
jgi:hypothetical protein